MRAILLFLLVCVFLYSQDKNVFYEIETSDYNKSALRKIISDFENNSTTAEQTEKIIIKECDKGDYLACLFYAQAVSFDTKANYSKVEKILLEKAKKDKIYFHYIGNIYEKRILSEFFEVIKDKDADFLITKASYYLNKSCEMGFKEGCAGYKLASRALALVAIESFQERNNWVPEKDAINFAEKVYSAFDNKGLVCSLAREYIDAANKINQYFPSDKQREKRDYQKKAFDLTYKEKDLKCTYNLLGNMYSEGIGTDLDYKQALYWYNKDIQAKEISSIFSYHSLGWMYLNGKGVRQDVDKAVEYYEKAGFPESNYMLGAIYQNFKKDIKSAKEYFGKACDGGYQPGCDEYKNINMNERPSTTSHSLNLKQFE